MHRGTGDMGCNTHYADYAGEAHTEVRSPCKRRATGSNPVSGSYTIGGVNLRFNKSFPWAAIALLVMFILVVSLTGCGPATPPEPTATRVPTATATLEPTEAPDWYNWWRNPQEEWPSEVNGIPVCYVTIGDERAFMLKIATYNPKGVPVFYFSEVDEFGDNIIAKRTVAPPGDIIMVRADGNIYTRYDFIENDTNQCRAFQGDGGNHAYWIMYENNIDGHDIAEHPDRPLFVFVRDISAEYVP